MSDPSKPDAPTASTGTSCNGMSLSLLAASIAFGWIGYRFGAPYGLLGGIGGAIAGVAIGFLATPLVLIAIIAFAHVGTRIESIFQKYKNG